MVEKWNSLLGLMYLSLIIFLKYLNNSEFFKLGDTLREVLANKPNKFTYKLHGASESANVITKIHNG
jgi:hypothetical protein